MAVKPVEVRRGVKMYRAEVPVENTTVPAGEHGPDLSPEVCEWLLERGFPDDTYSNDWTFFTYGNSNTADFYFKDPQIAMLFKLTFG